MIRHVTGWLRRFVAFRSLCLYLVERGVCVLWIASYTPLLVGLKAIFLEDGDLPAAAEVQRLLSAR